MTDKIRIPKIQLDKSISFLSDNFKYLFLFYILAECALLFRFPVQYVSDSAYYLKLAQDCIRSNSFYPTPHQLYDDLIIAPLYINMIILLLKIYNSTITIGIYNIILNSLQLYLLYKIVSHLFNEKTAVIAALFYMLYLNNAGMIVVNLTELSYTTLLLLSVYFYLKEGKFDLLYAGLFCGASIAVRPLGWALLIAYLIVLIIKHPKGKLLRHISFVIIGFAAFIIAFGSITKIYSGYFIYTSTTGPINILMSANDNANGGFYSIQSDEKGPGYIPGGDTLTFRQKQDIMQNRGVSWIKEHPFKWISFIPNKIILLFRSDDITVSRLVFPDFNFQKFLKILKHDPSAPQNYSAGFLSLWVLLLLYHHLFYFAGLILFVYGLFRFHKDILQNSNLLLFLIYAFAGIAITMIADSDIRFKYPYMFVVFICNAYFIAGLLKPYLTKVRPEVQE